MTVGPGHRVAVRVGRRWLEADVPAWPRRGKVRWHAPASRLASGWNGPGSGRMISAPMQGTVMRLAVGEGDEVAAGQLLAVIEAMKMENPLRAPHPGRVTGLRVSVGDTVAQGPCCVASPARTRDP